MTGIFVEMILLRIVFMKIGYKNSHFKKNVFGILCVAMRL